MKAVAYTRVSSINQAREDADGLPRQRLAIEKYAAEDGYEIVQWFEEKGVSGRTDWCDRPEWMKMLEALNGTRTIIVERLDRLARDLFVQEFALRELKKRGVQLLTAAGEDTNDEDPTRVLIRQILGSVFQFERSLLVLKLRGARQRKKAATGRCEGRLPYGSRPGELNQVDFMMSLKDAGGTATEIARQMNSDGVPTRTGKPWHPWVVNRILRQHGVGR